MRFATLGLLAALASVAAAQDNNGRPSFAPQSNEWKAPGAFASSLFWGLLTPDPNAQTPPAKPAPAKTPPPLDPHAKETKAQRDARMHWWREARFGMFIHWGLYAVPGGIWAGKQTDGAGEWIMHDLKIPVVPYSALAPQFDPEQFNADTWVSIAKAAGMKYIVMTAKHHEGFAMFHTEVDGYNIFDATPFKRDPIAEMAAACRKQGLKFGVYYSQAQDWHHAGGAAYGGHWDPAQDGDLDLYVHNVAAPQVKELLTRYHPAILWWDTEVQMTDDDIRALTAAFKYDKNLIANNRLGNGVPGDTQTPEQFIPATGYPGKDWETCMTINDTWGYKSTDTDFKSEPTLLHNLIDIASKGGNYLLNVGPDPTGTIPQPEVERIEQMGKWLKKNGESIYATTHSPYKRLPFDGRATVKGNTLYLNVFTWPAEGLHLSGLKTQVNGVTALATGQHLKFNYTADGNLTVSEPKMVDPVSTAIAVHLSGPPVVTEPEVRVTPDAGGNLVLGPQTVDLVGSNVQVQGSGSGMNVGYWTNQNDHLDWKVTIPATAGGDYKAALVLSCEPGSEGSAFVIQVDGVDTKVGGTVAKTAGWEDFQTVNLDGTLNLTAGNHTISVVPKSKPGLAVMNLKSLTLSR